MKQIKLNKWDPAKSFANPDDAFTMVISATRKSGKSNLLKHLYLDYWYPQGYFDIVCLFSETVCDGFYEDFLDSGSSIVLDRFSMPVLREIMEKAKYYKSRGIRFNSLVIMDDCISGKDKYNEQMSKIFTNGRHYHVSIVYITQKLSYCSTTWYNNLNYIILMRNTSLNEKRYISEKILDDVISNDFPNLYGSRLTNLSTAIQRKYCANYGALIITPLVDRPNEYNEDSYKYKLFIYKSPNMSFNFNRGKFSHELINGNKTSTKIKTSTISRICNESGGSGSIDEG